MRSATFFSCSLLLCLLCGCDGFRSMRADINLKNENPQYDCNSALQLIDNFSEKHKLHCSYADDGFVRYCGLEFVSLASRVNPKTGILAIDLSEFGPISATKEYQVLNKDLSDLIQRTFKKDSVIINPARCTPFFEREFNVKLHDRRPKILYFVPWSIEPEFSEAVAIIDPIAKNNGMKESGCYAMSKTNRCRKYVGGDYIGVWESVSLDLFGDAGSETMCVKFTDRSCRESDLTRLLYDETLSKITELFGEAAITIPEKKE
jgi:hypothetical protein